VKLILDENLPPRWREYLAPFGITANHWKDLGNIGDPDEVILDFACDNNAVIVTQDLDFTRILALRGAHLPSVIQLRVPCPTPELIGQSLLQVLGNYQPQLRAGSLITLDHSRHRIRLLPLR